MTDPAESAASDTELARNRWGESQRRALLVHIEWHWHNLGNSPTYNYLAQTFGVSVGSVRHHCGVLESSGFLQIETVSIGATKAGRPLNQVVLAVTTTGRRVAFHTRVRASLS